MPQGEQYARRDPTAGPLHRLLTAGLGRYLGERGHRAPGFVRDELRAYLRCGVLSAGFARYRCGDCAHSRVVALSCKKRGFCPRCGGRRMAQQAKHLMESVLPPVPHRQWVLTFPPELRWRMAFDKALTSRVWAVVRRLVRAWYRRRLRREGAGQGEPGVVMAIQRFGGALNLNVHFHCVWTDGGFVERSDGSVRFVPVAPPDITELERLATALRERVKRLLVRMGLDADDTEPPALALAYSDAVTGRGTRRVQTAQARERARGRRKANVDGFDIDAHVAVSASNRPSLGALLRYILRPAVVEERLTLTDDGGVVLALKRPWRDGTTHLTMTQQRLIERLATLVPPPRANQLRYGGVYAGNARLRDAVVEYSQPGSSKRRPPRGKRKPAKKPRVPNPSWAELMRHSFGLDVLECERCAGRMRFVAVVQSRAAVERILAHMGVCRGGAPHARGPPTGAAEAHYEPDEGALTSAWSGEVTVDAQVELDWDAEFDQRVGDDEGELGEVRQVD